MREQKSQCNAASDSLYFLLASLTTSFVPVNVIPVFSIHDVTQKKKNSRLEYLRRLVAYFDSYARYLFDLTSQLDKPEF